ncbi:SDR family NAD(P)-dependent oxidoreductase [Jatrophihabitans sp.]|uniref:SDR family NAD(P)-dependent oxidoreductase n=1 Tax=Jatrophihabitans sp. TaxID=1932789 RepID=UPI002CD8508B|nr:SDR family NAD(P)-dependent oxidoreductase [Jatrophihabitans sp.]
MSSERISVVGISCRYPDANSPDELWENVLAGRRAFRRLPDERMRLEDYYSPDPAAPDRFYSQKAAVIEGFEFDRVKYRVAGSTYRSTDLTHWLALDTAARALADAGFPNGDGLNRQATGVVIGNSLTGEFSRASVLRLRWPYVRRTVGAALREQGWDDASLRAFLDQLEGRYKSPFAPVDEDMLAGGLANTIAGRICNHFDFNGGGYTVDGACSSSLLSVTTACNALSEGQLDAVIAGGVDLSIDPFEVIGFAKTGALATGEMRVYDRHSNGFWPGEGCGMLILVRESDAIAQGLRRYADIVGWGYSSDGKGGITRPEAAGHQLAIERAYRNAGFGFETVNYLEGHGTGTAVGDATELRAFSAARRQADPDAAPAAISTLKGNIGHTKAAAGVGGLLKAILAISHQVIPPATSHHDPHPELLGDRPALRVPSTAELWPADGPIRAGVSSMGFGGINTHVVLEQSNGQRRAEIAPEVQRLVRSRQDCELLLIDASSIADLRGRISQLAAMAPRMSFAELGDLAGTLSAALADRPIRAAVLVSSPEEAEQRLGKLLMLLDNGARSVLDLDGGVFLGNAATTVRVGLLFPGQGAGRRSDGGAVRRRFPVVDELYRDHPLPAGSLSDTAAAQPRIATSSVAGLRLLRMLGIEAVAAAGHSLGELTALHWAGAYDEAKLLSIATVRGRLMADTSTGDGAMAGIMAAPEAVTELLAGEPVEIAGYNGPRQTVVSGPADAVDRVCARAAAKGLTAMRLPVSHAFHSELVAPAAEALHGHLAAEEFAPVQGRVLSTVTGAPLPADTDLAGLLARQVREPVRFAEAVTALAGEVDLLLEVGPGTILRGLAGEIAPFMPTVSLETDSNSLAGLFRAVAACYVLGADIRHAELHRDRFTRTLEIGKQFRFFVNPCELAPTDDLGAGLPAGSAAAPAGMPAPRIAVQPVQPVQPTVSESPAAGAESSEPAPVPSGPPQSALDVLRRLAAERAELPLEAVSATSHPLDELHLSSITVGQIVNQASRELGLTAPMATSTFATSTLAQLAQLLDELGESASDSDEPANAALGVAPWVRAFGIEKVPAAAGPAAGPTGSGSWEVFASERHPLAAGLRQALRDAGLGSGVVLCLPRDCDEDHVPLMLAAARAVLALPAPARFVVVGDRRGAAGLAKTLCLEAPAVATTVVTLPLPADLAAEQATAAVRSIVADVAATAGFSEVSYAADGTRRVPVLRPVRLADGGRPPLGPQDVLLVTGGGKGITAECALSLAQGTGAAVGLLGRSGPDADTELAANLERMTAAGVRHCYVRADVTSAEEVKAAVEEVRNTLGPVTGVLHGAGRNEPNSLLNLDQSAFERTLAPKIGGLEAVLAATDPASLRLLVTFGSIIGRAGLRGEADYATANDWLTDLTYRVAEDYPDCRCVALEWSVWSGSGMGERLGVLESLMREGISPIRTEEGIEILHRVLADPAAPTAMVVMGRAEGLPTITLEQQELPLLRFLDRTQVHYPGIELVADADLSASGDLYLPDHLLDGDLLFPAVLGMEAMAQAATALTGNDRPPVLTDVEFLRPIVVPVDGQTTIRVAALVTEDGDVEAVIRSSDTGYQADHFRATLRYSTSLPETVGSPARPELLPLDPGRDLYGPVLFQGARFQRLLGYQQLAATSCTARIRNRASADWFAGFLAQDLVLADPGTRDALMHTIQCCVPDATLLPAGIERLYLADRHSVQDCETLVLHAVERHRDGDTYLYDLDVRDPAGRLVERWEGLRLQAVRKQDGSGPWLAGLLGPYLERRTEPNLDGIGLRCAVVPDGAHPAYGQAARREQTARALSWALGRPTTVRYRPDGKPEVGGGVEVSSSHTAGLTFAVAGGPRPVGCDVEVVTGRSDQDWADLLGPEPFALAQLLSAERGEEFSLAATRVWGAVECLRKVGRARIEPITVGEPGTDRWVTLRAGTARIATFCTTVRDVAEPVVFTMLAEDGN